MTEESSPTATATPKRQLTLFDSTCIIVGIIIGAGIYETSPLIAQNVSGAGMLIGVWVLGGLLSLIGALCYAELATAYPKAGGDFVYLTRGFGRPVGFLFAWAQLWVVRPGSIGAMAYVFARYANRLFPLHSGDDESVALAIYAAASVLVLTAVNILGVREGKWTQNILTVAKLIGLAGIVVAGLCFAAPDAPVAPAAGAADGAGFTWAGFRLAMIFVLFTYGGWNEMAYVGAEVRNPRKNILRALMLGTVAVTLIYVLTNVAFVHALGFEGTRQFGVATDVLKLGIGDWAGRAISLLICISALGAINGNIFTGARIYYAMGTEHKMYAWLGRWSRRLDTPVWSLLIQAGITLALVIWFGLTRNGFESMVIFTTPVFWTFLVLVGVCLFVLRHREPNTERPFRVPGYPITPIVFCLSSSYMVYASVDYALANRSWEAIWSIAILLVGVVLCFFDPRPKSAPDGSSADTASQENLPPETE